MLSQSLGQKKMEPQGQSGLLHISVRFYYAQAKDHTTMYSQHGVDGDAMWLLRLSGSGSLARSTL
jgi:hypothetical protein